MGSWGVAAFENDDSMDWASELRADSIGESLASALEDVVKAPYADARLGNVAVAAATGRDI